MPSRIKPIWVAGANIANSTSAASFGDIPIYRADQMPKGGTKGSGMGREGVRFAMDDLPDDPHPGSDRGAGSGRRTSHPKGWMDMAGSVVRKHHARPLRGSSLQDVRMTAVTNFSTAAVVGGPVSRSAKSRCPRRPGEGE